MTFRSSILLFNWRVAIVLTCLLVFDYYQIAIGTDDVYKTAEAIKLFGGKITREPGPLPGISTKITACLDPDGWKSVRYWCVEIDSY